MIEVLVKFQVNDFLLAIGELVDYESTLQRVAWLAVPFFADWCAVDMLDAQGNLRRLAAAVFRRGYW